jgi:hypothetical protein
MDGRMGRPRRVSALILRAPKRRSVAGLRTVRGRANGSTTIGATQTSRANRRARSERNPTRCTLRGALSHLPARLTWPDRRSRLRPPRHSPAPAYPSCSGPHPRRPPSVATDGITVTTFASVLGPAHTLAAEHEPCHDSHQRPNPQDSGREGLNTKAAAAFRGSFFIVDQINGPAANPD